jgi:hemolysin activation/secretion protein
MIAARHLAVAGLAGAVLASPALAQQQQTTPSREQVTLPTPDPQQARGTASVDSRAAIAQPTCPFDTSDLRLTLARVSFTRPDGSPLQPPIAAALAGVAAPTGDQSIRVVCDLRDQANEALRRGGWVASVQIPPQSIETGELTLHVVTARITEVRVRGNPGPYRDVLEARIADLKSLDPLNERDAERALLLAGDIPGLDVQLALRPAGTQPGDVIGDLNIVYRPFAILGNAQNFNSRALGRETAYLRGEVYGLTGLSDITYVGASTTADFEEQRIVQAGHILGLDGEGTTFGVRGTYAWSRPDLGALDLRTDTLIAGFDLQRPIVRSVNNNLRVGLGFDFVDQKTKVGTGSGTTPLNLDKLRVLFGRVSGEILRRRDDGSIALSVRGGIELRKGLAIFDSTPNGGITPGQPLPSRIDGNSRAFVARADLDAVAGLGKIFSVAASVRAQWANDPLLNYEEFSLGNLTIGRGYDPGSNSGDRAVGVRGEVRADLPLTPALGTQVFGFYDYVYLTNLDQNSTETGRNFHSYGGGVRFTLPNAMILEGMYAHPKDRALTIDSGPPSDRFLVSLIVQFRAGAR